MRVLLALIFVLVVNLLLFATQAGISEIAAEEGLDAPVFYTYEGSVLSKYDKGNMTLQEDVSGVLPSGQAQVEPTSGTYLTDTFSTFKAWLLDSTGLGYFLAILNAFPLLLKEIGLPGALAYAVGAVWHAMGLFLFILFLRGNV